MGIDHDVVLRSRLYDMLIMIVAELTVMILATRDDVTQFIRDVACDWDDSKYIEAEPAKYITVARKAKGTDDWFVGGKTGEEEHLAVVKLDFLDKGRKYECAIYQDAADADYEKNPKAYKIVHKTVKKGDTLKIKEARGGGFAVSLKAV